jgi:hypothetical protein
MRHLTFCLELRTEGQFWNAYLVLTGAQKGKPILLGSIALGAANNSKNAERDFIALMMQVVKDCIKQTTGSDVELVFEEELPRPAEQA